MAQRPRQGLRPQPEGRRRRQGLLGLVAPERQERQQVRRGQRRRGQQVEQGPVPGQLQRGPVEEGGGEEAPERPQPGQEGVQEVVQQQEPRRRQLGAPEVRPRPVRRRLRLRHLRQEGLGPAGQQQPMERALRRQRPRRQGRQGSLRGPQRQHQRLEEGRRRLAERQRRRQRPQRRPATGLQQRGVEEEPGAERL